VGILDNKIFRTLMILLLVVIIAGVLIFVAARPAISADIAETVHLAGGAFTVDGLRGGDTTTDVSAWMEEKRLEYFPGEPKRSNNGEIIGAGAVGENGEELENTTWFSLSGSTRIGELDSMTVRRTYYFERGALTSVTMKTDTVKGEIGDDIARYYALLDALTAQFGAPEEAYADTALNVPGTQTVTWRGAEDTYVSAMGYRYAIYNMDGNSKTDYFEITVLVKV
jgi:hypothetical protein